MHHYHRETTEVFQQPLAGHHLLSVAADELFSFLVLLLQPVPKNLLLPLYNLLYYLQEQVVTGGIFQNKKMRFSYFFQKMCSPKNSEDIYSDNLHFADF